MKGELKKKTVKSIKVDIDKCTGCRACELACSAFHAIPKYSSINPARSRIRVVYDLTNDEFVPIHSCNYNKVECDGRNVYTIGEKKYRECNFCGTICPARDLFKDPDSDLPLKCDICENDPPQGVPLCVQVCHLDALTYEEREEEVREEVKIGEMETALKSLVHKYGARTLALTLSRISQQTNPRS